MAATDVSRLFEDVLGTEDGVQESRAVDVTAESDPPLPTQFDEPVVCPNPYELPANEPARLRCALKPRLRSKRVVMFFRSAGQETFTTLRMDRTPKGWFLAEVPAEAVYGNSLQVYFEARDRNDRAVASNGSAFSPNMILLQNAEDASESPTFAGDEADIWDGDDPLQAMARRENANGLSGVCGSLWGLGQVLVGTVLVNWRRNQRLKLPRMSVPLVCSMWCLNSAIFSDGILRFRWRPEFSSSRQRELTPSWPPNQPQRCVCGATQGDLVSQLGSARSPHGRLVGTGRGRERFRMVISRQPDATPSLPQNDTIRGGPVVLGPAAHALYMLSESIGLRGELSLLAGVPDFAVVTDLNLGAVMVF